VGGGASEATVPASIVERPGVKKAEKANKEISLEELEQAD